METTLRIRVLDLGLEEAMLPGAVRVTCELPGVELSSRTLPLELDESGIQALDEEFCVKISSGDDIAQALQAALKSNYDEDSDLLLVVYGSSLSPSGEALNEFEIGAASINLRDTLLASGSEDETEVTLELFDDTNQVVGALSAAFNIGQALRHLLQPAAKRAPNHSNLRSVSQLSEEEMVIAVGEVQLRPRVGEVAATQLLLDVGRVRLSAELSAGGDCSRSAPRIVSLLEWRTAFDSTLRVRVPRPSAVREVLTAAAMKQLADEDTDLLLLVLLESGDRWVSLDSG